MSVLLIRYAAHQFNLSLHACTLDNTIPKMQAWLERLDEVFTRRLRFISGIQHAIYETLMSKNQNVHALWAASWYIPPVMICLRFWWSCLATAGSSGGGKYWSTLKHFTCITLVFEANPLLWYSIDRICLQIRRSLSQTANWPLNLFRSKWLLGSINLCLRWLSWLATCWQWTAHAQLCTSAGINCSHNDSKHFN